MITTIGAFLFAVGILLFLINVLISLRRGAPAGNNPWEAPTLEWSIPSPPPPYNFSVIPIVASRHPLWEDYLQETSGRSSLDRGFLLDKGRETLATTVLDAEPDLILKMPGDSYSPFVLAVALGVLFAGFLGHWWWWVGAAGLVIAISMIAWSWPNAISARGRSYPMSDVALRSNLFRSAALVASHRVGSACGVWSRPRVRFLPI